MPAAPRTHAPPGTQRVPTAGTARTAGSPVLTLPGHPVHVSIARAFTSAALRAHGLDDDGTAGLLVSELVTNCLQHSDSARPGGILTVAVITADDRVLVEVADDGGDSEPALHATSGSGDAENGRGLLLVDELSAAWGHYRRDGQRVTWFELKAGAPS